MTVHLPSDPRQQLPHQPSARGNGRAGHAPGAVLMTEASLDELRAELEQIHRRTRLEIAHRLREARAYGDGSNNDEYHAVREEQMVLEARIASLEETLARAIVLDAEDAAPGVAVIGSSVLIEDLASGALSQYRLASAHHSLGPDTISAASPIGQALIGTVPGTTVTVELPNGRSRTVRLVDVESEGPASPRRADA
jgi:transcription elongation factor GreA